jgi:hypothetical protein
MPARLAAGLVVAAAAAAAGRVSATRGPLAAAAVAPGATLAPVADAPGASFASVDDAREVLARARRDYARAAAFLSADPASASDDAALAALEPRAGDGAPRGAVDAEALRARLATLDALIPGVRAAAREAPEDPAVNQLYLAAYDARETALRQLGRSLPAGVQLTGY